MNYYIVLQKILFMTLIHLIFLILQLQYLFALIDIFFYVRIIQKDGIIISNATKFLHI